MLSEHAPLDAARAAGVLDNSIQAAHYAVGANLVCAFITYNVSKFLAHVAPHSLPGSKHRATKLVRYGFKMRSAAQIIEYLGDT